MTLLTLPGPTTMVSLADMKAFLQIAPATTTYDVQLANYLAAAAEAVADIGDVILPVELNETYDGNGPTIALLATPVQSVVLLTEYSGIVPYVLNQVANPGQANGPYCYQLDSASGLVVRLAAGAVTSFPMGRRNVVIDYVAGQSAVTPTVQLAAKKLVKFWWRQDQQGDRTPFGQPTEDVVAIQGYAYPRQVVELLRATPGIA